MASVFGATTATPIVVRAGKAILTINNKNMIATDVTVQFGRNVEKIPVIGRNNVISIGEPQGTLTANSVITNDSDLFEAMGITGEGECSGFDVRITFADGSCSMNGRSIIAKNCFASSLSVSMQGGRGLVAQGVQVTFTALDV